MRLADLTYRTMFAELAERSLDAAFSNHCDVEGRFVAVSVKGRRYWYFDTARDGAKTRQYVGPAEDAAISQRVEEFQALKDDHRARRKLVSTLVREAGFARPEAGTGEIVAALSQAGLFRMRAVLVGTVAYQCLGGLLGVRLPSAAIQTGDTDLAQFHSISAAVEDSLPPVLDILRGIDPSFRGVPHLGNTHHSTQFVSKAGYRVEFLTPNTGKAEYEAHPATMPALGGAFAQPLRFLDFLIHEPVRSVMLHKAGIPVTVPAPERFAVHKLIVATRRPGDGIGRAKADKDLVQAASLVDALVVGRRQSDLATAWAEAWERGRSWQDALKGGLAALAEPRHTRARTALREGLEELGYEPLSMGIR